MKHIIYEMISPEVLQKTIQDGYYLKKLERFALQKLDVPFIQEEHDSFESAMEEITKNAEKLKSMSLTILPSICIDYEGKIL